MARNHKQLLAARLFSNKAQVTDLSSDEMETKSRWMYIMTRKLDNPLVSNKELLALLQDGVNGSWSGVSQSTAYADIASVNELLGNVKNASKEWVRYTIMEGAKEAYEIARDSKDPQGMAKALDLMGKYSRADKDDDAIDLGNMLPPVFEPTDDVTVLEGITPLPNLEARRRELRAVFKGELRDNIIDIEAEEDDEDT